MSYLCVILHLSPLVNIELLCNSTPSCSAAPYVPPHIQAWLYFWPYVELHQLDILSIQGEN